MPRFFPRFGFDSRFRPSHPARARRIARLLHALGEPVKVAERHGRALAGRIADGPRGERLAILEHRERSPGGGDRGREAWVLRRVLGWSDRDAAKALDCSRTALHGHLQTISGRFDDDDVAALRQGIARVDGGMVHPEVRSGRAQSGWSRLLPLVVAVAVVLALVMATRWFD